jgi:hypothetical protein
MCETKPICPRTGSQGCGIVRNKPNSAQASGRTSALRKRTYVELYMQGRRQNKPNLPRSVKCAKRSQFPAVPGGAGPGGPGPRDESCKTKPICHPACWDWRDRSRETKPIAPWKVSGGDAQPTKSRGLSCETNPIWPKRSDEQVRCRQRVMTNSTWIAPQQNEANSRRRRTGRGLRDGDRGVPPPPLAPPASGLAWTCRTNKANLRRSLKCSVSIVRNKANLLLSGQRGPRRRRCGHCVAVRGSYNHAEFLRCGSLRREYWMEIWWI